MKLVISGIVAVGLLATVVAVASQTWHPETPTACHPVKCCQSRTSSSAAVDDNWGTIKGKIIWGGEAKKPGVIKLNPANPGTADCLKANKGKLPPDEFRVINPKNKGLKDTFLWLVDADKKALPIHPKLQEIAVKQVEVDQPACHFIAHCIALREGQTLLVKNSSPFQHNFRYQGNPTIPQNSGNFLMAPSSEVKVNLKTDRLPIQVSCSIHPWMNGWVRVFDHPYYAVTDADGSFEIKNAPAGKYQLMIWHASAGWLDGAKGRNGQSIEIRGGAPTDLGSITFPEPKD